jgi:hypothetical protein
MGDDGMAVKIKDLIDEMDMQMDKYNKYLLRLLYPDRD